MQRREILKILAMLPAMRLPTAWADNTFPGHRTLVLLELKGGNDGLNTVIPYRDDAYYRLRPSLAIAPKQVLTLSETAGLNPAMRALLPLWEKQQMAVVQGVGYPRPNRSHFRSIEIWETASESEQILQQGWVDQALGKMSRPADRAADAVILGAGMGAFLGDRLQAIQLLNPARFLQGARKLHTPPSGNHNAALEHILQVQQQAQRSASVLEEKLTRASDPATPFPKTRIGHQFQLAAKLIRSGVKVPVIKVSHGSFDTHANQRNLHDRLLTQLAEALLAFTTEMQKSRQWEQVLIMSYSEFGRRVAENGSRGTDHGTAAPHFLLGGNVRGGLYGQQPSLTDLAGGDLKFHVDFRSLYALVNQKWWHSTISHWPVSETSLRSVLT